MSHLLLIHTENKSRKKHFEMVRSYCDKVFLIKDKPTWENEYVDEACSVDTRSIEKTVAAAKELASRHRIDGVTTFAEYSVPSVAAIAEALGLPYVSFETAIKARNKYEMRQKFLEADLLSPKFKIAATLSEAMSVAIDIGYPVVVKPLIGGGSSHIRRINNPDEMRRFFPELQEKISNHFQFDPLYQKTFEKYGSALLIEEYMHGGEVSVESVVWKGETQTIAIHDKPMPMHGPYFEEVYFTTPSRLPDGVQSEIIRQTRRANQILGIQQGATHTEFRITDQGPMILETAARLGGGPVYKSVLTSTGVDMVKAVVDMALGQTPKIHMNSVRPTGFFCLFAKKEGRFKSIKIDPNNPVAKYVHEIESYKNVGDAVLLAPKSFHAHAHVVFTAPSMDEIDVWAKKVEEAIEIEVEHE